MENRILNALCWMGTLEDRDVKLAIGGYRMFQRSEPISKAGTKA